MGGGYSRELINWITLILQVWLNFTVISVGMVSVPGWKEAIRFLGTWPHKNVRVPGNLYYNPEMLRNNRSKLLLSSLALAAIMKLFRKKENQFFSRTAELSIKDCF